MNKEFLKVFNSKGLLLYECNDHDYIMERLASDMVYHYIYRYQSIKSVKRIKDYTGYDHFKVYQSNGYVAEYYVKEL